MKKILLFMPFMLFATEINEVRFEGLKHISQVSANEISLVHKGDNLDLDKIDQTIKNFYEYGYFKNIKADFDKKNKILTFKFIEKPSILLIKYKNVSADLEQLLKDKIKRGDIFSEEKLKEIRNFITSYYDAKGLFNSVVIFKTEKRKNGIILDIIVNKGHRIIIDKLKFYGVKKEDIDDIKSNLENVNRDILGWLPFRNSGYLSLKGLFNDPIALKEYYLSKGYLDVDVKAPLLLANFDNNKASLEYKVYEGYRYKVESVNIEQPFHILDLKEYKDKLLLLKGHYFNIKRVKKDIKLLTRAVKDKGYAYAIVYPDIQKDKDKVKVIYKIKPGNKVYISDVIISGNTKTLDSVIRRNIYLYPGYLYSLTDKEDSINALKRTGYFDDVKIIEKRVDQNHIKIIVKVKEGLTGSLKAGISYNSYSKFGIDLSISENNVFGSGQRVSLSFNKSSKNVTYNFDLLNPAVNDSKYSLETNIYKTSYTGYSYKSKKTGISFTVGKSLTRFLREYMTYGYESLHLTDIDTNVLNDYRNYSSKSYVVPSLIYNSTDDRFFPQHGIKAGISATYAGIGGTQRFFKTNIFGKFFYSLDDKFEIMTILKYKFRFSYLNEIGYTPLNERFYLGGLTSIRGYDWGSVSPKDSNGNDIGGDIAFINSFEISVPVNLKKRMWLSAFIDNGSVGENHSLNITRSSYGISFNWISPLGPLDFTYALPINPKKDDELRRFEFSIGTSF